VPFQHLANERSQGWLVLYDKDRWFCVCHYIYFELISGRFGNTILRNYSC
jgi:hypothetical protein